MLMSAVIAGCAAGICASLADAAVCGTYKRQIRIICALILIISVTKPLLKIDISELVENYIYEFESIAQPNAEQAFSQSVKQEAEENLSEYITARLSTAGINPTCVSIQLTVTDDGLCESVLADVTLSRQQEDCSQRVREIISDELCGEEVTVNVRWE